MEKTSRTTYTLRNIFANFAGYGLNLILSFICRIIFVRFLSKEYLGINGLFSNVLSMLSLAELGIGSAIVYALYKPIAENDQPKIASLMRFYGKAYRIIGCVVAVVGLCLLPFLDFIIGEAPDIPENIHLLYVLFLFQSAGSYFFSYRSTILTASQRNYVNTTISYAVVILQNIVQIIILWLTRNFLLYLIVQILCTFITYILISEKAKRDYPYIVDKSAAPLDAQEKRSLVKNVKALTITKLSGLLVNSTDNIVITYFNGLITTGIASNYTLFTGILKTLLEMVFGGTSASVGNLNATESDETKYRFFKALNFSNFWLYSWAAVGIICVSSDLVGLFFGSDFVLELSIPVILAVNFYMVGMQSAVWNYRSTLGLFRYGQYLLLVTAALNIAGDIILGSRFGLFGIYLATAISRLVTNTWYDPYAVYKHGLHRSPLSYLLTYLMYAALTVLMAFGCYWLCGLLKAGAVWTLLYKLLICVVVPNGVYYLLFRKTEEFTYFKNKTGQLLHGLAGKLKKNNA